MIITERRDGTYSGRTGERLKVSRKRRPTSKQGVENGHLQGAAAHRVKLSDHFSTPQEQLRHMLYLRDDPEWGQAISKQMILEAVKKIPSGPFGDLKAPVLVPYLGSVRGTWERLVHAISGIVCPVFITDELNAALSCGALFPESGSHQPGLRWETVDFGHDACERPLLINEAAHLAVFAGLLLHPAWTHAISRELPSVVAGGYLFSGESGLCHPKVSYDADYGGLVISAVSAECTESEAVYPRIIAA